MRKNEYFTKVEIKNIFGKKSFKPKGAEHDLAKERLRILFDAMALSFELGDNDTILIGSVE